MAVTNVAQDQIQDNAGNLVEVYDITFTAGPNSQSYTVQVPTAGDAVAAANQAIAAKTAEVEGIYAL